MVEAYFLVFFYSLSLSLAIALPFVPSVILLFYSLFYILEYLIPCHGLNEPWQFCRFGAGAEKHAWNNFWLIFFF